VHSEKEFLMNMNKKNRSKKGFSMVELIIVIGVISVMTVLALPLMQNSVPSLRANAAMDQVIRMLRSARHSAISDRRITPINFIGNNQIQLSQVPPNGGAPVALDIPSTLEGGAQFIVFPTVPDTPMAFGNTVPISFTNPANPGGGFPATQFLSDGSFGAAVGVPVNGTVFIGIPGQPFTARAVTVLGSTGRIRAYHWDGTAWQE
jgi:prepilin-type N-terminal cleavage/methylation domain-containing protein